MSTTNAWNGGVTLHARAHWLLDESERIARALDELAALVHDPLAVCAWCRRPVESPTAPCPNPVCQAKDEAVHAAFRAGKGRGGES